MYMPGHSRDDLRLSLHQLVELHWSLLVDEQYDPGWSPATMFISRCNRLWFSWQSLHFGFSRLVLVCCQYSRLNSNNRIWGPLKRAAATYRWLWATKIREEELILRARACLHVDIICDVVCSSETSLSFSSDRMKWLVDFIYGNDSRISIAFDCNMSDAGNRCSLLG